MRIVYSEINVDREYYEYMAKRETHAEVVLLLPRGGDKILTLTKRFYPEGLYNLPSGKLEEGESFEQAFAREALEETGLKLECRVLVAVLSHLLICDDAQLKFTSYMALGDKSALAPHPIDPVEQISEYKEATAADLRDMAKRMRSLDGRRQGFGQFRATALDVAACYLSDSWNNPQG